MRSTPSSARAQQLRGKGKWPGRAERIDDITRPKRQALEKSPEALRARQYIESRWKAIAVRIVLSSIFIYITHWRSSIARRWWECSQPPPPPSPIVPSIFYLFCTLSRQFDGRFMVQGTIHFRIGVGGCEWVGKWVWESQYLKESPLRFNNSRQRPAIESDVISSFNALQ